VTEPLPRRAARVLLVDEAERVLLFRGSDPGRPGERFWFTPGGGLEPAEPSAEGAARELAEETGLRVSPADLGPPVWHEVTDFPFDGQWYRQEQDFFLVRLIGARAAGWRLDTTGFEQVERDTIDDDRWWEITELDRTTERFYPTNLPAVLRRALAGELTC
jgi:8-oxo-dGTP pyrophosphatase MutT (NUDIX family)